MESRFKLQIVDKVNGDVVEWEPGLSIEMAFVEDITNKIISKRVGFFTTKKKVAQAVKEGLEEAIFELKAKVKPRM